MQQESIHIKGFSHKAIGVRDPATPKDFCINKKGLAQTTTITGTFFFMSNYSSWQLFSPSILLF
jgi:hypothetical protein